MRYLQRNDPERRVEGHEIRGVATDHGVIAVARADHDGCIDDINRARVPAEGTRGAGFRLVERYDTHRGEPQESS